MEANKPPSSSSGGSADDKGENQHRRGGRHKNRKRNSAGGGRSFSRRQNHRSGKGRKSTNRHTINFPVPIVFVGMMGCGKTTIANALATKIEQSFRDSDLEIERASNATINEIFEQYGEDYFRDGEHKVIKRLIKQERRGVIATGGGAYMHDATRAMINKHAICVWLRADLETIWSRVNRRNNRPLLQRPDAKEFLKELLIERTPIYEQAHVIVDVNNGTKLDMVRKTLGAIKAYVAEQRQLNNPKFMPKNVSYKNRSPNKKPENKKPTPKKPEKKDSSDA